MMVRGALLTALLVPIQGCSTTCDARDENANALRFSEGHTSTDGRFYETNAFDEPFLPYEPGRRLELVHGLISAPNQIAVFVAFEDEPLTTGSGFAPAAGNQAEIESVNETTLVVRNDTCSQLFVRVEASVAE